MTVTDFDFKIYDAIALKQSKVRCLYLNKGEYTKLCVCLPSGICKGDVGRAGLVVIPKCEAGIRPGTE